MIGTLAFRVVRGRFFGIEFYLDYSWFLIAAIVTYELAARPVFPHRCQGIRRALYFAMGMSAALIFFLEHPAP